MVLEKYLEVRTRNSEFASPTRRPDKQVIAVLYLQPSSLGHTSGIVKFHLSWKANWKEGLIPSPNDNRNYDQILKSLFGAEGIQKSITRIS